MPSAAQSSTVSINMPGSGSSAAVVPSASARWATCAAPSSSQARASSRDTPGLGTPAQKDMASAPVSAATSSARDRNSIRRARPAGSAVSRVGSCLARGSSRKRAPVSTTQPRPNVRSRAARRRRASGKSGAKGSR